MLRFDTATTSFVDQCGSCPYWDALVSLRRKGNFSDPNNLHVSRFRNYDAFSDIPYNGFGFILRIHQLATCFPGGVRLFATIRDKDSWLHSVTRKHEQDVSPFLWKAWSCPRAKRPREICRKGKYKVEKMYERHSYMIDNLGLPKMFAGDVQGICKLLDMFPDSVQQQCRVMSTGFANHNTAIQNLPIRRNGSGPCAGTGRGSNY